MEVLEWCKKMFQCNGVVDWCKEKFQYYVFFSRAVLFILGLLFSYKLVEKVFFDILITHLTDEGKKYYDPRKAAIIVNLQEGISAVVQIMFAFVADAYLGLFKMVFCSTTFYIIGLLLTYVAALNGDLLLDVSVFYPALLLMTLSQAAQLIALQSFLGDQLVARDPPPTEKEEERAQKRCNFWWKLVSVLATIIALIAPFQFSSFRTLSLALTIAMMATFLWFLLGFKFYTRVGPTKSPLTDVLSVICSAISKRKVGYPQTPEQLYPSASGSVQILPDSVQILPAVSWLRWLDRAAVKPESPVRTVEQVHGVKLLLKMLPLWATFLTFSLVAASGSTFFLDEATSISDDISPILIINFQRFIAFVVSEISDYVLEKLGKNENNNLQRMMLKRLGIGMMCCFLCCIAAWAHAHHMLKNHMSVFWVTPQYFFLGAMEGLSADGLENFFDSQVSRSMSKYGAPFGECVMGVGKFLSVVCMLILSRWFQWSKDESKFDRLDEYYLMLVILSSVNFICFCLVAYWYGDDKFLSGDASATDIETGDSIQVDQQVDDILGPLPTRSLSTSNGRYNSPPSFSGCLVDRPEESSCSDILTENTDSVQSQAYQEKDQQVPGQGQQITFWSSSTVLQAENRRGDHEAETLKPDNFDSTDRDLLLASEANGPSDNPVPLAGTPFLRQSSMGFRQRSRSMRSSNP